jgi:hypothetical protein
LGRIAYEGGDFFNGFHWMSVAKDRLEKEENKTADLSEILDYLAWQSHEVRHIL